MSIKPLLEMNWGKLSAAAGAVIFVGLAVFPLAQRAIGADEKPSNKEKGGWAEKAMQPSKGEGKDHKTKGPDIKAATFLNGTLFLGSKMGLYEVVDGKAKAVPGFPPMEVKALGPIGDDLAWVATKEALYVFDGKSGKMVYDGEVRSVAVGQEGQMVIAVKDMGLMQSADGGKSWSASEFDLSALSGNGKSMDQAKKD